MKKLSLHLKKWLPFFVKGAAILPAYFRYWGALLGLKRIIKSIFFPGFQQLSVELGNFSALHNTPRKPKRKPDFILVAPDFTGNSAGISSLYKVCADLISMGFEAAITGSQIGHPYKNTPLLSTREAKAAARQGSWVIYPETVHGNPLSAKNVIRWVLNRPGLLGGDQIYAATEHVFVYSDVYTPYVKNLVRGKLYVPTLDKDLFYPPTDPQTPRSLTCYYVGKSEFKDGYFNKGETFEITRFVPARTELGKLFRSSKVLYCFDNSTALIYEALLCGCPVIIVPDGTQTWEDYKTLELGVEGISWGVPTLFPEPVNPFQLEANLARSEAAYRSQLTYLTEYCEQIRPTKAKAKSSVGHRQAPQPQLENSRPTL